MGSSAASSRAAPATAAASRVTVLPLPTRWTTSSRPRRTPRSRPEQIDRPPPKAYHPCRRQSSPKDPILRSLMVATKTIPTHHHHKPQEDEEVLFPRGMVS